MMKNGVCVCEYVYICVYMSTKHMHGKYTPMELSTLAPYVIAVGFGSKHT